MSFKVGRYNTRAASYIHIPSLTTLVPAFGPSFRSSDPRSGPRTLVVLTLVPSASLADPSPRPSSAPSLTASLGAPFSRRLLPASLGGPLMRPPPAPHCVPRGPLSSSAPPRVPRRPLTAGPSSAPRRATDGSRNGGGVYLSAARARERWPRVVNEKTETRPNRQATHGCHRPSSARGGRVLEAGCAQFRVGFI